MPVCCWRRALARHLATAYSPAHGGTVEHLFVIWHERTKRTSCQLGCDEGPMVSQMQQCPELKQGLPTAIPIFSRAARAASSALTVMVAHVSGHGLTHGERQREVGAPGEPGWNPLRNALRTHAGSTFADLAKRACRMCLSRLNSNPLIEDPRRPGSGSPAGPR